jgi:hypothetical protein
MSDKQVGQYIRLLCLQHQKGGYLTKNDLLKICGGEDPEIFSKFKTNDNGFYNQRMLSETLKRKSYSESRSKNREKKDMLNISDSYVPHMENENENENINESESEKKGVRRGKNRFTPPELTEVIDFVKSKGYSESLARKVFEYYSVANWVDAKGQKVKNWKQKIIAVWLKEENNGSKRREKADPNIAIRDGGYRL